MRLPGTGWLLFLLAIVSCNSCHERLHSKVVERSFYYWKSAPRSLSEAERKQLTDLHVKKLYVKFFEIKVDPAFGNIPVAKTNLELRQMYYSMTDVDSMLSSIEIVPTIYVQNEVLQNIETGNIDSLASNIIFLAGKYYDTKVVGHSNKNSYKEIQIDCDWTKTTRDQYFKLLRAIKLKSGKIVSCTLRLYPYKYRESMGVPPVDKAMLMCYNLTSPLNSNKNSILEPKELESYLLTGKKYPLHLDVALPLFNWMQIYQNTRFAGLLGETQNDLVNVLRPVKPMWYEVMKDTLVDEIYLRAGDMLKSEEVTAGVIDQSIDILKKHLSFQDTLSISFFHLDNKNLKMYSNETLDKFYTDFTK